MARIRLLGGVQPWPIKVERVERVSFSNQFLSLIDTIYSKTLLPIPVA